MTSGEARLTTRGRGLLLSAAALGLGGLLFGVEELYPLAGALVVLVVVARIWMVTQRWDVRVIRHIHPVRVPAGVEARVELTIRNTAFRRSPPIYARDPFDGGKRWARFAVAPLRPGEVRVASYRLPTTRRGVFRLGPLELEITDPFGLARSVKTNTPDTSLTVHPKVEPVSSRSIPAHSDHDTRLPQPVLGRGGNEFYGLREYVTGDDLRHVHWPSTARIDDLVIRQPENLWRGRISIAADLRSTVNDSESLEAVLSAVASLATSALAAGLQIRVVTTNGVDTGYASTRVHATALLDVLASAGMSPGMSLTEGLRVMRTRDTLILVTTDGCTDGEIAATVRFGGRSSTVVIFEKRSTRSEGTSALPSRGRGRFVRVPVGVAFRAAWEGAAL